MDPSKKHKRSKSGKSPEAETSQLPTGPKSQVSAAKPSVPTPTPVDAQAAQQRRSFLTKVAAISIGSLVGAFPFLAGLGAIFDPVLRKRRAGGDDAFISMTRLDELQTDGPPRRFQVITDQDNAWTRQSRQPIGAVYLRRTGEGEVQAFTATCPHAGCFIGYSAETNKYLCPCHNSAFELDGAVIQPTPSPRGMDSLPVEIRPNAAGEDEVFVKFEQFYTGRAVKELKA